MGVRELVVAGNRVRGVDKLDDYLGVLWTGAIMANGSISGFPLLQGIEISNNTFEEFPRRGVVVQSAAGVVVRGNVFNNSLPNDPPAPERGQLLVDRSSNVAITDNTWTLGKFTANPFVRVEGTAGNVSIVGNALV